MKLSKHAQMLYELGSKRELARREERAAKAWDQLERQAMFPSAGVTAEPSRGKRGLLGDGERSFVSPLDGRAKERGR
jgi:hypothetical protein